VTLAGSSLAVRMPNGPRLLAAAVQTQGMNATQTLASETRSQSAVPRFAALDAGEAWPAPAAGLLANLGFTLINGSQPGTRGSHLLVALRSQPTFRHFDPEALTFYEPAGEKARPATVDRSVALEQPARPVLWGHVHVVDRLAEENRFLTFGGVLRAAAIREGHEDLTVLDFLSPGPILRWGGHSQGTDSLTGAIGAFFGRLIVPIDFTPGIEARVDAVPPEVLYAAFLMDLADRLAAGRRSRSSPGELDAWTRAEVGRVHRSEETWAAAERLLVDVGLRPPMLAR
jgi:hypothetical protein